MNPVIGAGLVQAGSSVGGGLFQAAHNRRQQARHQQHVIDMWHKNNDWNSPTNQVRRLLDAGLNPHLAIEGISGAQSSPAQSVGGENTNFQGILDPAIQVAMQLKTMSSDLETAEVNREETRARIANADIPRLKLEMKHAMQDFQKRMQQLAENRSADLHQGNMDAQLYQQRRIRQEIDSIAQQMLLAMRADGRSRSEHAQQLRAMMIQNNVSESVQNYIIDKHRLQPWIMRWDNERQGRSDDLHYDRSRMRHEIEVGNLSNRSRFRWEHILNPQQRRILRAVDLNL